MLDKKDLCDGEVDIVYLLILVMEYEFWCIARAGEKVLRLENVYNIIIILVWVKKFSTQFDHWTKPDKK